MHKFMFSQEYINESGRWDYFYRTYYCNNHMEAFKLWCNENEIQNLSMSDLGELRINVSN